MKRKQFRLLPCLMALWLILVLGYGIYVIVATNHARTNFHRSPEADGWDMSYSRMLKQVKDPDFGFDLNIPGLDGAVTFTAPFAITYQQFGIEEIILKGAEISSDFISISVPGKGRVTRIVTLTVEGHETEVTLKAVELSRLYRAALGQNGLTDQFAADFGTPLTRLTSRNALRVIDAQLYDRGIITPRDYPFDQNALMSLLVFGVFGLPILLILCGTLLSMQLDSIKYNRFLREYNREHRENWDKVSGTLPQFQSLKASGISTESLPPRVKKTFLDTLKEQFRPVGRKSEK